MSLARNLSNKYKKQLLDTGIDSLKIASKKVVHKTRNFIGSKTVDAVTNWYDDKVVKTKPLDEIIIPPEKRKKY